MADMTDIKEQARMAIALHAYPKQSATITATCQKCGGHIVFHADSISKFDGMRRKCSGCGRFYVLHGRFRGSF